jgi:hypothetical protein
MKTATYGVLRIQLRIKAKRPVESFGYVLDRNLVIQQNMGANVDVIDIDAQVFQFSVA